MSKYKYGFELCLPDRLSHLRDNAEVQEYLRECEEIMARKLGFLTKDEALLIESSRAIPDNVYEREYQCKWTGEIYADTK